MKGIFIHCEDSEDVDKCADTRTMFSQFFYVDSFIFINDISFYPLWHFNSLSVQLLEYTGL
jgi:hypothetical protein